LGSLKVIDYWEDLGVGGRITKLDLREIGIDGTNWIWLAQDRVQWWAFVNMVMNLEVP
jgi:hypothetical protein